MTSRALCLTSTLRRSPGRVTLLKGVDHWPTSPDPKYGVDEVCHITQRRSSPRSLGQDQVTSQLHKLCQSHHTELDPQN